MMRPGLPETARSDALGTLPAGRLVRGAVGCLILACLAACAAGGPVSRPLAQDRIAGFGPVSPTGARTPVVMGAEGPLPLSRWTLRQPRAVILAVHGFGDYGPSTFSDAAEDWAARSIATWAYDQRGFGRNPSRGAWPSADGLIDDLRAVAGQVRVQYPCVAIAVVGHSMGGGVALAAGPDLAADGSVDGLVLAAPAIWGGDALNPLHRFAAWSAAALVPDRRITGGGIVRIQASDNIAALRALGADPLYLAPPSAREILGLVRVADRAAAAAPQVALPALLLLGERDQIVPTAAVTDVFMRLSGPKQTITYPDGWHLLFRDLQADRVIADVVDWVLALPAPDCPVGHVSARGAAEHRPHAGAARTRPRQAPRAGRR